MTTPGSAPNTPGQFADGALDLSQLGKSITRQTDPTRTAERPGRVPAALKNPTAPETNPFGHDLVDVMPNEMILIESIERVLNERYMGKQFGDADPTLIEQFETETINRFDEIGFVVKVEWIAVEADGLPGRAYMPTIQFVARTERKEIDHEQMQREVQGGLAGGGAYSIRADGSKSDEPIKKNIF